MYYIIILLFVTFRIRLFKRRKKMSRIAPETNHRNAHVLTARARSPENFFGANIHVTPTHVLTYFPLPHSRAKPTSQPPPLPPAILPPPSSPPMNRVPIADARRQLAAHQPQELQPKLITRRNDGDDGVAVCLCV